MKRKVKAVSITFAPFGNRRLVTIYTKHLGELSFVIPRGAVSVSPYWGMVIDAARNAGQ